MRLAAGMLLLLAIAGCGASEAGSGEQHCYYSYDASYTPAPEPIASSPAGCTPPSVVP